MSANDLTCEEMRQKLRDAGVPVSEEQSRAELKSILRRVVENQRSEVPEAPTVKELYEAALLTKKQLEIENKILDLQIALDEKKAQLQSVSEISGSEKAASTGKMKLHLDALNEICYKFGGLKEENVNVWLTDVDHGLSLFSLDDCEKLIAACSLLYGEAKRLIQLVIM